MKNLISLIFLFISFDISAQILEENKVDGELVLDNNTKAFYSSQALTTEFFIIMPDFSVIFDRKKETLFVLDKSNIIKKKQKLNIKKIDIFTATFFIMGDKVGFGSYNNGNVCAWIYLKNGEYIIETQKMNKINSKNNVADFKKIILENGSILQANYFYTSPKDKTQKIVQLYVPNFPPKELYKTETESNNTDFIHQHPRLDIAYFADKIYVFDTDKLHLRIYTKNGELITQKAFSRKEYPDLTRTMTQFKIDIITQKLYLVCRGSEKATIFEIPENNMLQTFYIPFTTSIGQIFDGKAYFFAYSKKLKNNYIYFTEMKKGE